MSTRILFATLIAAVLLVSGCADDMLSDNEFDAYDGSEAQTSQPVPRTDAPYHPTYKKLRHPQLLERAISYSAAGKTSSNGIVHLFLAFNEYQPDGITRRVLDDYGITRRILDDYGITRRVLDDYGITRRVLDDYGVTSRVLDSYGITRRVLDDYGITARVLDQYQHAITAELLAAYGLTFAMLEEQGITRRVLDDYGITRRVLDDYNLTDEDLEAARSAFESVISLRLRISKSRPGISIKINRDYFDIIMEEFWYDPDIELIEPDPSLNGPPLHVLGASQDNDEMIPWSLGRIGGIFTRFDDSQVHVYVLDSGVYDRDLNVVEEKDFTMLFTNRDQEYMDEEEIIHLDVFDPGNEGNPNDESGHGTHVAGILGAEQNGKGIRGVARGVKLHSLKVLTREGKTDITTVMAAVDYVTDQKQRNSLTPMVMNLSLGMDLESGAYNALDEAIARAVEYGVVVVVSAGNDGRDATSYSPAHVREAITVGAYDRYDRFASFSNHGPSVDILAPGDLVPSLTNDPQEAQDEENILMSGTSHAAPQVAGAAALYLALHPDATPAEVKQALVNHAQPEIEGTPTGTTNRTVYVGLFAEDGQTLPLSFDKADWSDSRNELRLEGEGPRLAEVEILSGATDEVLGTLTIDDQGKWLGGLNLPEGVPCSVVARVPYNDPVSLDVREAPENCLKPFVLDQAEWKGGNKRRLRVKGTGPQHAEVVLLDAHTLATIATSTVDGDGDFDFDIQPLQIAPCVVRVELPAEELSRELPVDGAETGCATSFPVTLKKVQWGSNKLKVVGTAEAHSTIDLVSATSGSHLSALRADYRGDFDVQLENLPVVPCEVRLVPRNGAPSVTAAVQYAPEDCEGAFRITTARWDDATASLEVRVNGPAFANLTLGHARTGQPFHQNTLDARGKFERTFRNMAVIPCAISATANGTTVEAAVENKPSNCDVALKVTTLNWADTQQILSAGGTLTPGLDVALSNADNDALISEAQANTQGDWRFDLDLSGSELPPCTVRLTASNGDSETHALGAASCDPDFTYTNPTEEEPEQNPHSFILIDEAEWDHNEQELDVEGTGYVFMTVTLTNTNTGEVLGTTTVDQNEEWEFDLTGLATIPCTITAELDGRTKTLSVSNAPLNCDGRAYLRLTKVEWDSKKDKLKLEGEGLAADNSPNATITFTNATTGTLLGTVTTDSDGDFREELRNLSVVPCTVRAELDGVTKEMSVNKAPNSCQ